MQPQQDQTWTWLAILIVLFLVFGKGGGVTQSAPFKTDKLSVLIVEESTKRGEYTSGQRAVMQSTLAGGVLEYVTNQKSGNWQVIDLSDQTPESLKNIPPWLAEALKVPRPELPWIVAANARRGFSEKLTDPATVLPKLKQMEGE